ncbi:hypothetical protein [Curtobacterium sp. 458]|uniref:hypothetical protein n=1 Tax=Curtobacterium sp. 458 TaxID=3050069 RepID=UPI0025B3CA9A|nr:hypothetical protein [Curtobacterium sp. 458]WJY01790.1 hypothetical protein QPJ90_08810 [Curtobacterium sp. 458]
MPQRPSKLARAVTASFVVGGVVVAALAFVAVVQDPTSDPAWVAILLGVLLVVWGVAFARMSADDSPDDDQTENTAPSTGPLTRASEAIALLGVYVVMRMLHRPLDSALVGVGGVLALRLVQLTVDRIVRRREARNGDPGPATD